MSDKGRGHRRLPMAAHASRQSKAAIAVTIHSQHIEVCNSIRSLRDAAATLLASENPMKRARRELLVTADTLLSLQGDVQQKIPNLMPSNCTKYSIRRLQSEADRIQMKKHIK